MDRAAHSFVWGAVGVILVGFGFLAARGILPVTAGSLLLFIVAGLVCFIVGAVTAGKGLSAAGRRGVALTAMLLNILAAVGLAAFFFLLMYAIKTFQ